MDLKEIGEQVVLARATLLAGVRFSNLSEAAMDTLTILRRLERSLGLKVPEDEPEKAPIAAATAKKAADDFDDDIPF